MGGHKHLKSISHNFGHSFISPMNYLHGDYMIGHLLRLARNSTLNKFTVNILRGSAKPKMFVTDAISTALEYYCSWFPMLVVKSGSSMAYVASAVMTIEFNLSISRQNSRNNNYIENPFVCEVIIIDDRGKEYKSTHTGWRSPEPEFW